MKIDLHGLSLWEAKEELIYKFLEAKGRGIHKITIIHGYKKGEVLKNYIRSKNFLKEMDKEGFKIKYKDLSFYGKTIIEMYY